MREEGRGKEHYGEFVLTKYKRATCCEGRPP
jgi:hypothetical protein